VTRILHISDTHFGTEVPEVEEAFWKSVAVLRPDIVVHSGDVTQRALAKEYDKAVTFMAKFGPIPKIVVPGNHDIPLWNIFARLVRPYSGFQRAFGQLNPSYEDAETLIVTLNTTRWWRHKNGTISSAQVEQVAARVRTARPRQLRIIVAHHPLYVPFAHAAHDQAIGAPRAARQWSRAGVDVVLGGHIHLPYFATLPPSSQVASASWVVQAGTATSRRTRRAVPNSFNLIERYPNWYKLQRWDFALERACFEVGSNVNVPLKR
jgi:3',5'-cyclic AMP phosphodiesterase CpdA